MDFFGLRGFLFSNGIGETLVIAYGKPRLAAVGSVCFQYQVQLLDVCFGDPFRCMVDDIVDATEMVDGLMMSSMRVFSVVMPKVLVSKM